MGQNPFSDDIIEHTFGYSNGNVIIRAEKDGNVGYSVLGSWQFNMEYWRGNTNVGTYQLPFPNIVGTPQCETNHNVASHTSSNVYLAASNSITSWATINSGANITYDAGTRVRLTDGFHAKPGSTFRAFINGCSAALTAENTNAPEESSFNATALTLDVPEQESADQLELRNYPNPFTEQTSIEYVLSKDNLVTLIVSDLTGKQIAVVVNNEQVIKGTHIVSFDGSHYPAGMYYYTIQAGKYLKTQKMTLMK